MKKYVGIIASLFALSFVLIACSSDNNNEQANNESENRETNEEISGEKNEEGTLDESQDTHEENDGNQDTSKQGFNLQEEIKNVNEFYSNSYVPNTLKNEVKSGSMKVSLVDGEKVYEARSVRLLKGEDDGDGMRLNVTSEILNSDGEMKDEDYFFGDGEEVAEGVFEDNSSLKWKKNGNYYTLLGGRVKSTYSSTEGSSKTSPEDDRLAGYMDLVKVEDDIIKLLSFVEKALIPEQLPDGYEAVQIGYSEDPMRGYDAYTTEMWINYENENDDKIFIKMFSGYDDMSESAMRDGIETIEGVEVNTSSSGTEFIVNDVYYEIKHEELESDEKEAFLENLLK